MKNTPEVYSPDNGPFKYLMLSVFNTVLATYYIFLRAYTGAQLAWYDWAITIALGIVACYCLFKIFRRRNLR